MFSKINRRTAGYQPAMSVKRERLCGRTRARANDSSRDYAARSAGSGFRAFFVFLVFFVVKRKNLEPRNHTKIHEQNDSWFKVQVDPVTLTSCGLLQRSVEEPGRYRSRF
jgi:hypothetical protein